MSGPLSLTGPANTGAWIPLPILTPDSDAIVRRIKAQSGLEYLPAAYTAEQKLGFIKQKAILADSLATRKFAAIELPFSGGGFFFSSIEHPLSRGTVLLDPTDIYAEPLLTYNTFQNPEDASISIGALQFIRKWMATPSAKQFTPSEILPGAAVASDSDFLAAARTQTLPSTGHGCGTASMMPRNLGGVVSSDLLVYGVTKLSVGDISIIPLIPGTHTCATVYAIAEKVWVHSVTRKTEMGY